MTTFLGCPVRSAIRSMSSGVGFELRRNSSCRVCICAGVKLVRWRLPFPVPGFSSDDSDPRLSESTDDTEKGNEMKMCSSIPYCENFFSILNFVFSAKVFLLKKCQRKPDYTYSKIMSQTIFGSFYLLLS